MKVAIRVDSSTVIGAGHVMRCLSLADELRSQGAQVSFVCRPHSGHLGGLIAARGYRLVQLELPESGEEGPENFAAHAGWLGVPWQVDAEETRAALEDMQGVDWLVVDHYSLDSRWEACQRPLAARILAIDDLADRPHDCDILLDQNLNAAGAARYDSLLPESTARLVGPRYALLRAEFASARAGQARRDGSVRRLLIFFGGVDADNLTGRLLSALEPLLATRDLSADVILGSASPHAEEVARRCAALPALSFHHQVADMARLMVSADLAIGAAGTAVWERCCLGLPSIVVPLAENQLPGLSAIGDCGAAFVAAADLASPDAQVAAILDVLPFTLRSPAALRHQAAQAASLVDAAGCRRVVRHMGFPAVSVRPATAEDGPDLHAWRNHEDIRRYARDTRVIDLADHLAWLQRILDDRSVDLLVCEDASGPLGVLRYDHDGDSAEVSIYRVPGRAGDGIGRLLLEAGESWLRGARPGLAVIRAEVMGYNPASRQMFEGAGYTPILHRLEKRLKP